MAKKAARFGGLSQTPKPEKAAPAPSPAPAAAQADEGEDEPTLPVPLPRKKPSRQKKKVIAGHFSYEAQKAFAMLALEQDKTHQALLAEALNDLFRKNGKHPLC